MLNKAWPLLAWRHWGILRYNSIWQNITVLFYLSLTNRLFSLAFIGQAGLFMLFSTMMTAYGYLINDLADVKLDQRHGKPNVFQGMSQGWAVLVPPMALVSGLLLALPFLDRSWFLPLWLVWILAATSYSLPPLRFKDRGAIGLVATIAAQQTLPTALMFAAWGKLVRWEALIFILFATIRGISSDVSHQMRDWSNDAGTSTSTFAVRHGYDTVQTVYAINLELERLALGLVVALLLVNLPPIVLPLIDLQVTLAWPLALVYGPLFILMVGCSWRARRQGHLALQDPYNLDRQTRVRDTLQMIHHSLPSVLMPLYLAAWMTLLYWPNMIFVLILFLLHGLYLPQRWAIPVRAG